MYALVVNNQIQKTQGRLPSSAHNLETGELVCPHNGEWTKDEHEACGWFAVVETVKPDDTATHTFIQSRELVNGVPTVVWTQRAFTTDENTSKEQEVNRTTISEQVDIALANNRIFLQRVSPSNGQILDQVRDLTIQMNKLIRLVTNRLDGVN